MNCAISNTCQRFSERKGNIIINIHRTRRIHIDRQEHRRLYILLAFFFSFLFGLFKLFLFLLTLFLQLFLGLGSKLRHEFQRVCTGNQLIEGIRIKVGKAHLQGIHLIDQGIPYPVLQRIDASGRFLHDKSIGFIEIQSLQ